VSNGLDLIFVGGAGRAHFSIVNLFAHLCEKTIRLEEETVCLCADSKDFIRSSKIAREERALHREYKLIGETVVRFKLA
jgi:hypothetical protein